MPGFATVARPYAKALFELMDKQESSDSWLLYLKQLSWLLEQHNVLAFLNQAKFDTGQQVAKLIEFLSVDMPNVSSDILFNNFLQLVAKEKRLEVLPSIYCQYSKLILNRKNVKQAIIYTAYNITDANQQIKLIKELELYFNTSLDVTFSVDPNLMGGVKVVCGDDKVLDLSIRNRLNNLYATMVN